MSGLVSRTLVGVCVLGAALGRASAGFSIAVNPATGSPEAVWSDASAGGGSGVVFYSFLQGEGWAPSLALSGAGAAGPALAFDDEGGRRVAWQGDAGAILLRSQAAGGSTWSDALTVSAPGASGAAPSVLVFDGDTYVAYEATAAGGGRQVVSAQVDPENNVERCSVGASDSTAPLGILLHTEGGVLWVDWIDSSEAMGFSVRGTSGWGAARFEPCEGPDDVKAARERIRGRVQDDK